MLFLTQAAPVEPASLELDFLQICLRLLCAMVVGLVIGTEREYTHRPAGMRTHILVSLGACAVMITGQLLFAQYSTYGATPDPGRLSAQVITGVGFLGAGTIMREGANVKGLTTAASLWAVACLGIAAGAGYYTVALAGMVFVFATLTLFEIFQNKLVGPHGRPRTYVLQVTDISAGLSALNTHCSALRIDFSGIQAQQLADGSFLITFRAALGGGRGKNRRQRLFEKLMTESSVTQIREVRDSAEVGSK